MAGDFYGFEDEEARPQGRDHLFLWTVFILILVGAAFASWLGSFYIFGHPEQPRSYAILKKLKKIEAPRRFEVTAAPGGDFFTPQRLFEKYSKYERLQLEEENAELLRNYIKNYKETKKLVPYMTGKFEIVDTYQLKPTDIFPAGVVALAVADQYSQVVIEHVFTTAPEHAELLRSRLPRGRDMRLEKTRDLAAIIHIERTEDGRLLFTAVPLLYGTWGLEGSMGSFSLEPPPDLNLKAGMPVVRGQAFVNIMKAYAEYRQSKPPAVAPGGDEATVKTEPLLVRVDTVKPGGAVPETGAMPEPAVATPIPISTPRLGKLAAGRATPAPGKLPATPPRLALNPLPATPGPVAPPPIPIPATPFMRATPAAVAMARPGVPLKPFISSTQPLGIVSTSTNWPTYARGKQPPGRAITPSEATTMADQDGEIAERLYLRGDFVVTASRDNNAVLRAPAAPGEASQNGMGSARIIVEFPPSAMPPAEGSTLSRDESAGFEVRKVRRGADGQVNIYVREITGG